MADQRHSPSRGGHYHEPGAYQARLKRKREREEAEEQARAAEMPSSAGKWWYRPEGSPDVSGALWGWAERLKLRHRRRVVLDALWEAIYKDTPTTSLDADSSTVAFQLGQARQNIAKSMVDTVTARLAKRRPFPVISADDAGHTEKLFARRASRILRRKLGTAAVERMRPLIARDGVIRGSGVAKAFRSGGDVQVERVPRRELLVDPAEAQYGPTRTLAQCKRMDRDVLMGMFPDRIRDIASVSRASFDDWRVLWSDSVDVDHVDVIEGWHLPSVPGAADGRHVICLRSGVAPLLDEPWTRPRFPFSIFHWEPPIDGFWGVGLIESLGPIQMEVNRMLGTMAEGIEGQMALKVFAHRGSGIEKHHLQADFHVVIEHDGQEPHYVAPTPFSPAVLSYLQWRIQQAYELSGVSQASAASKNPLGSNASGKALDTMYDLESDRFSDRELNYAMFAVDLGTCILDEARVIALDEEMPKAKKARWIREHDWSKIDIDEGEYNLILEPINFLSDARSGKLAQVKEMGDAGLHLDPMQTAALFDEPDLARANRHLLGPYRMLERWCEDLANVSIPLETLMPTPQIVARVELATRMVDGELANVIAEASPDDADAEEAQARYRWALDMLQLEAEQLVKPEESAIDQAAGVPPGVDPAAAATGMGAAPGMPAPGMPAPMPPMPGAPGPMPPIDPALAAGAMAPIDPMGGLTAQFAAGMPAPPGAIV